MLKNFIFAVLVLFGLLAVAPAPARADDNLEWEGDVDGMVEVAIRDRSISYRRVTGDRPRNVNYDFDGSLPSRSVPVRLTRREGRGRIEIVQNPDRNNNYTAVVRCSDPSAGTSRYKFTLRWPDSSSGGGNGGGNGGNNGNWPGNGGNNGGGGWDNSVGHNAIRWSGRVDGVNDVRIQGNDVQWRKVEGRGAWDVHYRVGDRLPNAQINVRIDKRRGRGSVYVLTPPGRQNNYTLTVRVVDKDQGDDTYDFTIQW